MKHVRKYFDAEFFNRMAAINVNNRHRIIYMHPDDFLALALKGGGEKKTKRVADFLEQSMRFPDLPYLWIDTVRKDTKEFEVNYTENTCIIIAHEGRHRTRALKKLGYNAIPVVIHSTSSLDIKWFRDKVRPEFVKAQDGYRTFDFAKVFDENYKPVWDKEKKEWL